MNPPLLRRAAATLQLCAALLCLCTAPAANAQSEAQASRSVLIIVSDQMNGRLNMDAVNDKLRQEVIAFADATRAKLGRLGWQVVVEDLSAEADQKAALVARLRAADPRHGYLGQVYWSSNDKRDVNIVASFAPLTYNGASVRFGGNGDARFQPREYFLFGAGTHSARAIDDDAEDFVNSLKLGEAPKQYRVSHIMTASAGDALAALERLKTGERFDKVAADLSTDPGTRSRGGELKGWATADAWSADFAAEVRRLAPGQVSSQPVQTEFGWHIVRVDAVR